MVKVSFVYCLHLLTHIMFIVVCIFSFRTCVLRFVFQFIAATMAK